MTGNKSEDSELDMDAFEYVIDNFEETLKALARKEEIDNNKKLCCKKELSDRKS